MPTIAKNKCCGFCLPCFPEGFKTYYGDTDKDNKKKKNKKTDENDHHNNKKVQKKTQKDRQPKQSATDNGQRATHTK